MYSDTTTPRIALVGNSCVRGITSIYISVVKERHGACRHACVDENLCVMRDQQQPPASSFDAGHARVYTRARRVRANIRARIRGPCARANSIGERGISLPRSWLANDEDELNSANSLVDDAGKSGQVSCTLIDYVYNPPGFGSGHIPPQWCINRSLNSRTIAEQT